MRNKIKLLLLAAVFVITTGCNNESSNVAEAKPSSALTTSVQEDNKKMLSYERYSSISEDLSKLTIPNFNFIESPLSIIAVNKALAFDNREYLTVDGEQNENSTQRRIIFQSSNKKQILFIDLIYLNHYIGNDIVYWNSRGSSTLKNNEFVLGYNDIILSFNNLLIKFTLFNEEGLAGVETINEVAAPIVKYFADSMK